MIRALEVLCGRPWAIHPDWLTLLAGIAAREHVPTAAELAALRETRDRRQALAAQSGRALDGARDIRVRDGVAVQSIFGPLVPRADFFDEVSGAADVAHLAQDFAAATRDPQIRAILLHFDSPGGDVTDIGEFAAQIRAGAAEKPVAAYVSGYGASGAYWLASAAGAVVVSPSALLGSIGVYSAYRDTRERDAKAGVATIEFVSSQSPRKRPDPATEGGRAQIQARVDDLAAVFIAAVAGYRGLTPDQVTLQFGGGDVFVGAGAVTAGLADRVGSFEQVLAELAAGAIPRRPAGVGAAESGREDDGMSLWQKLQAALDRSDGDGAEGKPPAPGPAVLVPGAAPQGVVAEDLYTGEQQQRQAAEAQLAAAFAGVRPRVIAAGIRAGHPAALVTRSVDALVAARDWESLAAYWQEADAAAQASLTPGTSADRGPATRDADPKGEHADPRTVVARYHGKHAARAAAAPDNGKAKA